jgi:hypothetical protein
MIARIALTAILAATFAPAAMAQDYNDPNYGYPHPQADARAAYDQGRADQARQDDQYQDDRYRDYAPPPADAHYDGYCYARKDQASATGLIAGAAIGGAIGNGASNRWDRGGNTIAGALVGAMLGSAVGRSSVDCYDGTYYAYDSGYYAPPPPPSGYTVVYFNSRPSYGYRYVYREHDRPWGYGYHHRW